MGAGCREGDRAKPTTTKVWDILPSLSGTPDPERRRRLLLVLHAYIDDSGQTEPPVFVLAGYVARAERWAEFSDAWKAALAGPPVLDYFKMWQASTREEQFKGWSVEARDARLRLLAGIIRDHALLAVAVTAPHDDYKAVFMGAIDRFHDRPYSLLYHSIMFRLLHWQIAAGLDEPVDFIFDEQMHDSDRVQAGFSDVLEATSPEVRRRFGARPVHRDEKKVVALQAADMLAWHVRRYNQASAEGEGFDTAAWPTLRKIPGISWHWTRDLLEKSSAELGEDCRKRQDQQQFFPYEIDAIEKQMDSIVSRMNHAAIEAARPGEDAELVPILASGMRRYLLVHSCERCGRPHLHRRSGNECLAGA
jgi:Protein of unknown function (DUF3800)